MPHVEPLPWEANPQFRARFQHYQDTRGFVPNSILTMQRRPAIAAAFMELNKAVLYEGTVAEELKMLVSLVTSQASGCRYCQAHMTNLASIYTASDEKIRAVWSFETSALFSPAERAALRLGYHSALVPNHRSLRLPQSLERHDGDDARGPRRGGRRPGDRRGRLGSWQARRVGVRAGARFVRQPFSRSLRSSATRRSRMRRASKPPMSMLSRMRCRFGCSVRFFCCASRMPTSSPKIAA